MVFIADLKFCFVNSKINVILSLACIDYPKCEKLKIFSIIFQVILDCIFVSLYFNIMLYDCFCSVIQLCPTLLWPHGMQHTRPPCL